MRRRNNQTDFVTPKRIVTQVWRVAGEETKANVHPAFFQRRLDIGRGEFLHCESDPRVGGDKRSKQFREQCDIKERHDTDMQRSAELGWLAT